MNEVGIKKIIATVSDKTGYHKDDVDVVFRCIFETIMEALVRGDRVVIPKFGTFKLLLKQPRECVDPRYGTKRMSNFKAVIKFEQARRYKDQLANLTNPELDWGD